MVAGMPSNDSTSLGLLFAKANKQSRRKHIVELLNRIFKYNNKLFFRSLMTALMLSIISMAIPRTGAAASQATLSWAPTTTYSNGSPVTSLGGYKIHTGTASGNYSRTETVGNQTSWTVADLADGATYYFAVSAYDSNGNESSLSNEVTKTIAAAPVTYSITATAGSGGSITAQGNVTANTATSGTSTISSVIVVKGASQTFAITPSTGYKIAGVTVDGASVGAVSTYTFGNVAATHSISAIFTANIISYSISASAGTGGAITPIGTTTVTSGSSQAFAVSPNAGYKIADIKVDGVSVGAVGNYIFNNITANHTIAASFTAVSGTVNGTVVFADNGGGTQYTDSTGVTYLADSKYSGGSVGKTTAAINGTVDDVIYQTERYGNFSYSIPVANGNYNVTLKFAETYFTASGKRVFSVMVNGQTVISNLDLYAKAGKNAAYDVVIPASVTNGILSIQFVSQVNNAKVSGILISTR